MRTVVTGYLAMGLIFNASCIFGNDAPIRYAIQNGAELCITFRVTDTRGVPVTNAQAVAYFSFLHKEGSEEKRFATDTNGMCTVKGLCSIGMSGTFSKEGYYASGFGHKVLTAYPMPSSALKDGKWQPWNPTVDIILKEKRNPIPMYVKSGEIILPKTNEPFGIDFQAGDLLAPHGNGKVADMVLTYVFNTPSPDDEKQEYFAHFALASTNKHEGVIVMKSDTWSEYKTVYEASLEGYEHQFETFKRFTPKAELEKKFLATDEYLVFRSRVITNEYGQITSAHYGKIYSASCWGTAKNPAGGAVHIRYFFNPISNDRNVEFDTNKNLFGNDSRNRVSTP